MFSKKIEKITPEIIESINAVLPEELRKPDWGIYDFGPQSFQLTEKVRGYTAKVYKNIKTELIKLFDYENFLIEGMIQRYTMYNVPPTDAQPFGLVDVGQVEKFTSASTGNKFENGLIGFAIETSFEKVWAENNSQQSAVLNAKKSLIKRAMELYPESNSLYNYDVDFRELGSSGNVFIYMRGTACKEAPNAFNLLKANDKDFKEAQKERVRQLILYYESVAELHQVIPNNLKAEEFEKLKSTPPIADIKRDVIKWVYQSHFSEFRYSDVALFESIPYDILD